MDDNLPIPDYNPRVHTMVEKMFLSAKAMGASRIKGADHWAHLCVLLKEIDTNLQHLKKTQEMLCLRLDAITQETGNTLPPESKTRPDGAASGATPRTRKKTTGS